MKFTDRRAPLKIQNEFNPGASNFTQDGIDLMAQFGFDF